MQKTFEITPDRNFLQHFLTGWRVKSLSPEMVEKLKACSESDPYAAYGYGRWLSLVNPGGECLKKAEVLLTWAGTNGVQDANAALAQMYFDGRTEADKAMPQMHAFLMDTSYKAGSELAQVMTMENTIFGDYGFREDPALVADILQKHIEKHPECDTLYYDLLGMALEDTDPEAAQKAFRVNIDRGDNESYYSLASLYQSAGDWDRACLVADEGARNGAVNCRRFKARMSQEDFLALSGEEQEALHKEISEGLDYAIAHHDRYACFLKGICLYYGNLGYTEDIIQALEPLERGCEMGHGNCFWLKSVILHELGRGGVAKASLQAARLGDREQFTLEQVARGYVSRELSNHAEEIEELWLKEYLKVNPEDEDSKDSRGVIAVYPQGFYYAMDVDDGETLNLEALAEKVDARGFDVVHFSPVLSRITKALSLEGCHVAMLVDKDGYMKDLPDNMAGTIIYGQAQEIRGTVIFVLEDDKTYSLMPMVGLQRVYMFIQLLNAATDGLVRLPSSEELESIGAEDPGGFEEYDDFEEKYDDPDIFDGYEKFPDQEIEQEIEEDMVSADTSTDAEPKEITVPVEKIMEGIAQCNLCIDTLYISLKGHPEYDFASTDDLFYRLGIMEAIEENIKRHGGYMIDQWQYVDARQVPQDIRSRVRFK
jgi:TPR repeat protein